MYRSLHLKGSNLTPFTAQIYNYDRMFVIPCLNVWFITDRKLDLLFISWHNLQNAYRSGIPIERVWKVLKFFFFFFFILKMVKSLIYDTFYGTLSYNYLLHMLFFLSIWLKMICLNPLSQTCWLLLDKMYVFDLKVHPVNILNVLKKKLPSTKSLILFSPSCSVCCYLY